MEILTFLSGYWFGLAVLQADAICPKAFRISNTLSREGLHLQLQSDNQLLIELFH